MKPLLPEDYETLKCVESPLRYAMRRARAWCGTEERDAESASDLGRAGFWHACGDAFECVVGFFDDDPDDVLFDLAWTYWDWRDVVENIFYVAAVYAYETVREFYRQNPTASASSGASCIVDALTRAIEEPGLKTLARVKRAYGIKGDTPEAAKDVVYPHRILLGRGRTDVRPASLW